VEEEYEYRTIRIERGAWPRVRDAVYGSGAEALALSGGTVFGLWRGEIGMHTDEGVVMSVWPRDAEPDHAALDGLAHVVESTIERVAATVRPLDTTPPTDDGIYAHRWFELVEKDWPAFLEHSVSAWPAFQETFDGTRIVGFWKALDVDPGRARVLLMTRYASLAVWERSRPYARERVAGVEDARERFLQRAELTDRTIVRIARLVQSV
jgi:hypothetical protein